MSTVSRSLNGNLRIPEATRKNILNEARKLGWVPNPLVSAYMSHFRSTRDPKYRATIGFVIAFKGKQTLAALPEFHRKVFRGAKTLAESMGYIMEPIWLESVRFDLAKLARLLKSRGIPGIIVHGGHLPEGAWSDFDWNSFASATFGFSVMKPHLHRSAFYMLQGIRMAVERIVEYGYQRIALIISEVQSQLSDHAMRSAFYYEARRLERRRWLRCVEGVNSSAKSLHKLRAWLETNRPDVVIGDDEVRQTLHEMRYRIPQDIGFVSPVCSEVYPEMAGIDQCPEAVGENCLDLIATQLVRNERGVPTRPKLVLNEGRWVDGPSLPRLGQ